MNDPKLWKEILQLEKKLDMIRKKLSRDYHIDV